MNNTDFLNQLLASGQDVLGKGQEYMESRLAIPAEGPEREQALAGMGKGAALAGLAAVLLGTQSGRTVTGGALKLGSLAAVGAMAYQAFQSLRGTAEKSTTASAGTGSDKLVGAPAEDRSRLLLQAMIAAAHADGHIDAAEQAKIDSFLQALHLSEETLHFIKDEIAEPADIWELAANVDSPVAAGEVYLSSLAMLDKDEDHARAYLDDLADALELTPALVAELEARQAHA